MLSIISLEGWFESHPLLQNGFNTIWNKYNITISFCPALIKAMPKTYISSARAGSIVDSLQLKLDPHLLSLSLMTPHHQLSRCLALNHLPPASHDHLVALSTENIVINQLLIPTSSIEGLIWALLDRWACMLGFKDLSTTIGPYVPNIHTYPNSVDHKIFYVNS